MMEDKAIIFKGTLEYCFSDNFDSNAWLTSFSVCILNEYLRTLTLEFWASEDRYEGDRRERTLSSGGGASFSPATSTPSLSPYLISRELFPLNTCVIGVRKAEHFIGAVRCLDNSQHIYFVCTPDTVINLRGSNAAYVMHQIQFKRCQNQAEIHDYGLDKIFRVHVEDGMILEGEEEYLLVVTPAEVVIVSLLLRKIVRHWPIVYIRKFGVENGCVQLELGKRAEYGDRVYTFATSNPYIVITAISTQINIISLVINRRKSSSRYSESDVSPWSDKSSPSWEHSGSVGSLPNTENVIYDLTVREASYRSQHSYEMINSVSPPTPSQIILSDSETESLPDIYQQIVPDLPENLYEPLETPVIYQEVDVEGGGKKGGRERKRTLRRRKRKLKPTFISYVSVDRAAQEEKNVPIYDTLYDPTLSRCNTNRDTDDFSQIYDKLNRLH